MNGAYNEISLFNKEWQYQKLRYPTITSYIDGNGDTSWMKPVFKSSYGDETYPKLDNYPSFQQNKKMTY